MNPESILHLYDLQMRQDPPPGRAQIHRLPGLTYLATLPPSPHAGWILFTRLDKSTVDSAIDSVIDFFRPIGGDFEWKVYDHDTPDDLKNRLVQRGFEPEEPEGLLAIDLDEVPGDFFEPQQADVRRITDPANLSAVGHIYTQVWDEPIDELEAMLALEMVETPNELSVYVAYVDGVPASSAWIRFYPERGFAELYGGSTIEHFRGRGLYRALVAVRALEARQRGVRFLAVDASPMSRPILQKLGFQFLTTTQPFMWHSNP